MLRNFLKSRYKMIPPRPVFYNKDYSVCCGSSLREHLDRLKCCPCDCSFKSDHLYTRRYCMYNNSIFYENLIQNLSNHYMYSVPPDVCPYQQSCEAAYNLEIMECIHSGLFVPVNHAVVLLGATTPSLREICHIRPVLGSARNEDKSCEILFMPLAKTNVDLHQAQMIMRKYLQFLNTRPIQSTANGIIKKKNQSESEEKLKFKNTTNVLEQGLSHLALQSSDASGRLVFASTTSRSCQENRSAMNSENFIEIIDIDDDNQSQCNSTGETTETKPLQSDDERKHKHIMIDLEEDSSNMKSLNDMDLNKDVINIDEDDDVICTDDKDIVEPVVFGRGDVVSSLLNSSVAENSINKDVVVLPNNKNDSQVADYDQSLVELIVLSETEDGEIVNAKTINSKRKSRKRKKLKNAKLAENFKNTNNNSKKCKNISSSKTMNMLRNTKKDDLLDMGFVIVDDVGDEPKHSDRASRSKSSKAKKLHTSNKSKHSTSAPHSISCVNSAHKENRNTSVANCTATVSNPSISRPAVQMSGQPCYSAVDQNFYSVRSAITQSTTSTAFTMTGLTPLNFNYCAPNAINCFVPNAVNYEQVNRSLATTNVSFNEHYSNDNVGTNVCVPDSSQHKSENGLRPIIIDACNVAFSHGRNTDFSYKGLEICINYFKSRGHQVIAILPNFRKIHFEDKSLVDKWESDGTLVFTPSRKINGKLIVSHDDRYIIQSAAAMGGIIVSKDNFREFLGQNELWDDTISKRLLMFTWVGDLLMFPEDPLGRHGPTLDQFLRFPPSKPSGSRK